MNRSETRDEEAAGQGTASGVPLGSLGAWLRTQREARGVSLRDIADASKISVRHLEALESDRFDALPAPVFVRGFLREYARVVGLDPDEVVNVYLLASAENAAEEPSSAAKSRGGGVASAPSPIGYGLLVAAVIVALLAVAAGVSFLVGRRSEEPPSDSARPSTPATPVAADASRLPASAPPTDSHAIRNPPSPPATPSAAAPAETPLPTPVGGTEAAGVGTTAATATTPETAAQPLHVVIEFLQDCWVEVVVDGQRRTSELKAGGEVMSLEANDYVLLTLGNVPAVKVSVDGRPFPLPSQGSRVLHGFRIDRESLRALREGKPSTLP